MVGRYEDRVVELVADAQEAAERGDWAAVRALASAALALAPDSGPARSLAEQADRAQSELGERRQLTVMFCDVVGSTELSQQRDPELVHSVLRSYQATCDEVVRRYEGRIARFVGDGVLAYFGHPVAHEDDARRGVKAGLDLLEAIGPVADEVRERYDLDLRIRVAVHTGLVVLADMGTAATPDRDAIVGETPNLAARLQDHATPGSLVISHDTYELVRPWFLVAPVGELSLKGISNPVRAYTVVEEADADDPVRTRVDLSPFVGRAAELDELAAAWQTIVDGGSASVALQGQAGVGKSRLADVLRRRTDAEGGRSLVASCSSFHRSTALYPFRRLLERTAGIDAHLDRDLGPPRLWNLLDAVGQTDQMPYLASLLELPATAWAPGPELDGPQLREHLLNALLQWLRAVASAGPALLLLEDLHWADPSTEELLGRIVRAEVPNLLLLLTAREDCKVPWSSTTVLALGRLADDDLGELARRLPEGRRLPEDELARAIERSDGIPLFLEELVRTGALAQGDGTQRSNIPPALRDPLLARFAAPGVDLRLAQLLATIGSEAPLPLVAAASGALRGELDAQLAALVDAGIVELDLGEPPLYRFRHHLLADLAYDTQLHGARRAAHLAVADALLDGHGVGSTGGPAVLAHHLERAGRTEEAVLALVAAAEAARNLGATAEVDELLGRAFDLLEGVPDERRAAVEFEARLLRGTQAASILGYAAPQAVEDFLACRDLMEEVRHSGLFEEGGGDDHLRDELVWAGSGLWATFLLQGRLVDAHAVNRTLTSHCLPGSVMHDYFDASRSFVDLFEGNYPVAETGLRRSLDLYRQVVVSHRLSVPSDPGVAAHAHLGFALAVQGRVTEARAELATGLEMARSLSFPLGPFSVCYAMSLCAGVELMVEEIGAARRWTEELLEVSERHGYTFWSLLGGFWSGAADLYDGVEGALDRSRMTVELLRSLGVLVWLPSFLGTMSLACLRAGDLETASALVADARAAADAIDAQFWTAELLRQQGELELAAGEQSGLGLLREAAELAAAQGAVLIELRAWASLCTHQGDGADRGCLQALLDRIDPDLATPDVLVARELLHGLT